MSFPIPRSGRQLARGQRRFDPYSEIEGLYDRMGQLMQGFVGNLPTVPAVADIEETDDGYVIELDVPGVKRDDLTVEVRDNVLRVSGEIKERERVGLLRRQDRPVGRFEYVVTLPGEVDPDKVEGSLGDGVLTVRLGKASKSQPRRIEIKGN
jgi:HSP20 family protein